MAVDDDINVTSTDLWVELADNRVVVTPNGGSVRGHGGKVKVNWKLRQADIDLGRTFTLEFWTFDLEDDPQGVTRESPLESGVTIVADRTTFGDKLKKLAHGSSQLISKYTVTINNAPGASALDPVIIVDR